MAAMVEEPTHENTAAAARAAETEHCDPVLMAYLALIAKDIASGRNLGDLPPGVVEAMRFAALEPPVDLDEELEGEVSLDSNPNAVGDRDGVNRGMTGREPF
jgi:hypothetical protein